MAHALTFTSATGVIWEEDWVLGQFARSDASSMWLFARAKGATADGLRVRDDTAGTPARSHCRALILIYLAGSWFS